MNQSSARRGMSQNKFTEERTIDSGVGQRDGVQAGIKVAGEVLQGVCFFACMHEYTATSRLPVVLLGGLTVENDRIQPVIVDFISKYIEGRA